MATDTVPAAAPGPSDPPDADTAAGPAGRGFLASMVAPVEPARPTFSLNPTTSLQPDGPGPDAPLDRSAPGVSSASFRDTTDEAARGSDPAGARHKRSVWKEWWLAAATRWAKGGGTTNKRLDVEKAKAQAQAHQVKENRTTTALKSPGLPVRNTGGSGAALKKDPGKSGRDSGGKGPTNSTGNGSAGAGRGGSGGPAGGRGSGGGTSRNGAGAGGRDTKGAGGSGKGPAGASGTNNGSGKGRDTAGKKDAAGNHKKADAPGPAPKGPGKQTGSAGGGSGKPGAAGKSGKDGASGKPGTGADGKGPGRKVDLTKDSKNSKGKDGAGAPGGQPGAHKGGTGKGDARQPGPEKTPLQKSREIGHGDGSAVRNVIDHVKAYKDGTVDGYRDKKHENAKEHARLDKAHTDHKATKPGAVPGPAIVTDKGDDGVSTDVKPLLVKEIDANTITLGTAGARGTVSRKELRNFKQYERKLETKVTVLQKISDACKTLEKQAEQEAKECQDLAEQAKGVKGGQKLVAQLNKLAEAAKNQAMEAAELARRAKRAAEMCKVVLTNIQTRYAPLYKAVVDSDETKPAELRFYNDKGSYAPAA